MVDQQLLNKILFGEKIKKQRNVNFCSFSQAGGKKKKHNKKNL